MKRNAFLYKRFSTHLKTFAEMIQIIFNKVFENKNNRIVFFYNV